MPTVSWKTHPKISFIIPAERVCRIPIVAIRWRHSFIGRGNHNTQKNIVDPLSMFRTHKCKWWKAYDSECSELTNVSGERHMIVTRRHLIATMGIRQTRSAGIINEIFGCVFQLTVGIAMGNNCALLIAGLFRKDYSYEVDFMQEFLKKWRLVTIICLSPLTFVSSEHSLSYAFHHLHLWVRNILKGSTIFFWVLWFPLPIKLSAMISVEYSVYGLWGINSMLITDNQIILHRNSNCNNKTGRWRSPG
jgi:hypothetical protein